MRRTLVIALAVLFVLSGGYVFAQEKYSDGVLKKIHELKILSRDKKDMPETIIAGGKMITTDELKKWLDEGKKFVLLDNRIPADYEKEHIPGAVRVSPDDLMEKGPAHAAKFAKKDDIIVNYCNGIKCWRSPGAAVLMNDIGYKNLYWYRLGIPDWIKKGYNTTEGKEPGTWKK